MMQIILSSVKYKKAKLNNNNVPNFHHNNIALKFEENTMSSISYNEQNLLQHQAVSRRSLTHKYRNSESYCRNIFSSELF